MFDTEGGWTGGLDGVLLEDQAPGRWLDAAEPLAKTSPLLSRASLTVDLWLPKGASTQSATPSSSPSAGCNVAHQSKIKKKRKSRTELRRATTLDSAPHAQLEAVAMAFFSCWHRISRVRDSRSRSWQELQTSTGSYSCWSGMGSFR